MPGGRVELADFGEAARLDASGQAYGLRGTESVMAPECASYAVDAGYGPAVDLMEPGEYRYAPLSAR